MMLPAYWVEEKSSEKTLSMVIDPDIVNKRTFLVLFNETHCFKTRFDDNVDKITPLLYSSINDSITTPHLNTD